MELPIYLIGYMGAGKTTIGRILAQKLGWHFVDLDDAFAEINGMSVANYIRSYGVEKFRKQEKDCVERLSELPIQKVIYATGGGYPCWKDNMDCLLELGTVIYLRWSCEHLTERLKHTDLRTRPLLDGKTDEDLLDFIRFQMSGREEYYAKAHHIVEAPLNSFSEKNDEEIALYLSKFIESNIHKLQHHDD